MRFLLKQEIVNINIGEQYKKQSYRTRAYILGPNNIETINVPVKKYKNNEVIKNIIVDYSDHWNEKSWKSIQNSYRNSPYFEYYEDYFFEVFNKKYDSLIDLNQEALTLCLKMMRIKKTFCLQEFDYYDFKDSFLDFNAKNRLENVDKMPNFVYNQNFGNKFEHNLSILDLLFLKGPDSKYFLS